MSPGDRDRRMKFGHDSVEREKKKSTDKKVEKVVVAQGTVKYADG